jgi:Family of unknown function (DUF5689)
MKTLFLKSALFIAIAAGSLTSCVKDDNYSTPELNGCTETTLVKNREVSQILSEAVVKQHVNIVPGVSDVIEAYVTSSDIGGNFFKSISFQSLDGSKAFSIPVDATATFQDYEPGRKVLIKMDGLYTDVKYGGIRIGGLFGNSSGGAEVGRLTLSQFLSSVNRSCTVVNENQIIKKTNLIYLKNDEFINKLVELDEVQFVDNSAGKTYYDLNNDLGGATNHLITDKFGNTLIFRTSSFSNFAGKITPNKSGKIRGILTKFGSDYQFLVRTEKDVNLDKTRFTQVPAFFKEDFEGVASTGSNQFVNLSGWSNVSINGGSELWEARLFSANKYAQMSAFGISEPNVDTRLITPSIDLSGTSALKFMKFNYKTGFANGIALTVWYSSNYNGSGTVAAVNAATWTKIDLPINVQDTSFSSSFYTVLVDLSQISGNVHFAFKYVGSSTGITTTYQVDNIEVYKN